MSFKKRILAVAAAGALGALAAVPAMAFENEFHGTFNLKYYLSNYEQGSGGNFLATPFTVNSNGVVTSSGLVSAPGSTAYNKTDSYRMNNYFEQRDRLFYTAKANDDLKLVTGFEIDSVWGDKAQGSLPTGSATTTTPAGGVFTTAAFRNSGGALEADAVNLETKWVYLDFKIPSTPTRVTAGIQAFKDQLKGIFLDADVAAVVTSTKLNALTLNLGYARGYDQSFFATGTSALPKGNENLDIGILEAKFAISKDVNAGFAYYLYSDGRPTNYGGALGTTTTAANTVNTTSVAGGINTAATMIHTFGLTGDAKVGPATLSGFLAYQGGVIRGFNNSFDSAYLNAFAYNVAAKAAVGPGTLKTALLFTSGNSDSASKGNSKHLTGWVGTSQSPDAVWSSTTGTCTYNESGMMLLNRNSLNNNTTTDNAIIYNTSNGTTPVNAQGLYLYTIGYDATITPKLYTNVNAGAAWVAHTNVSKPLDRATGKVNATNYMGTEVNLETGYKMYDNLTARFQAAYVILGGFYKGSLSTGTPTAAKDPENPYTARFILSYAF